MSRITDAHKHQFKEEGYFVLNGAIPGHHLELLRGEARPAMRGGQSAT